MKSGIKYRRCWAEFLIGWTATRKRITGDKENKQTKSTLYQHNVRDRLRIYFGNGRKLSQVTKMPAGLLRRARTYTLSFDQDGFLFRFFLRFLLGDQQAQHTVFILGLDILLGDAAAHVEAALHGARVALLADDLAFLFFL